MANTWENYEDIRVRVEYKNRDMKTWSVREYELRDYTDMLRLDLMRLIGDVEDMCEAATGTPYKEDWSNTVMERFLHIKHRLLDKAGEIGRLPDNLIVDDELPVRGGIECMMQDLMKEDKQE